MNQSLKTGLRKLRDAKNEWPKNLNLVLRGIRAQTTRSTKFSPFELLFGFQPRITKATFLEDGESDTAVNLGDESDVVVEQFENETESRYILVQSISYKSFICSPIPSTTLTQVQRPGTLNNLGYEACEQFGG